MIFSCRNATVPVTVLTMFGLIALCPLVTSAQRQVPVEPEQAFADFVRTQWVLLDDTNGVNGAIGTFDAATGRLTPTMAITLDLYDANARRVRRVTTGADGRFRIDNLAGGLYQCIAQGESGIVAFSLFAIQRGTSTGRNESLAETILVQAPRQTKDQLDLFSAAVPPTYAQLNAILQLYYGRTMPVYFGRSAAVVRNSERVAEDLRADAPNRALPGGASANASAIRAYDVLLNEGDLLVGRLYTMNPDDGSPRNVSDVYVHIIRDDRLVGPPIPVNREGVFEVQLLDGPGAYSIVAAGSGGFGACSFYARRGNEANAAPPATVSLASLRLAQGPRPNAPAGAAAQGAGPYSMTMSVVSDPRVISLAFPSAAADGRSDAGAPLPGGGFGGQSGPGGGVGATAGGNGLGRALLGGGLAAGITALAVGNNGQPLVSPFAP